MQEDSSEVSNILNIIGNEQKIIDSHTNAIKLLQQVIVIALKDQIDIKFDEETECN